jgi:hypothetical protein
MSSSSAVPRSATFVCRERVPVHQRRPGGASNPPQIKMFPSEARRYRDRSHHNLEAGLPAPSTTAHSVSSRWHRAGHCHELLLRDPADRKLLTLSEHRSCASSPTNASPLTFRWLNSIRLSQSLRLLTSTVAHRPKHSSSLVNCSGVSTGQRVIGQ